jgi:hypothetical protein
MISGMASVRTGARAALDIMTILAVYLYSTVEALLKSSLWRPEAKRCEECGRRMRRR